MTHSDHRDIVRMSSIIAGTATLATAGLLAATADGMFRFAIDTQSRNSIFRKSIIAPDRAEKMSVNATEMSATAKPGKPENGSNTPNSH